MASQAVQYCRRRLRERAVTCARCSPAVFLHPTRS